ncbi:MULTISPECIES: zf-HC2 domain-containing protein [unclassified Streptomyces]|uniref:zf-HC2 domain-containing protein n=1 Tax=unclassified Streptomyces TaxID=2593676 RepID=UPI003676FDD4
MQTTEPHIRVGAYALGVLGRADAFRFEEHLEECPQCRVRARELAPVAARLAVAGPVVRPSPGLADRLVEAVAAGRRRAGRRRLALVAAAVVLAVCGPLAVAGSAEGPGRMAVQRWVGADRASGAAAVVTAAGHEWGTSVALEVVRVPAVGVCALIAVGRDGSEETVSSWSAGGAGGGLVEVSGGAALRPEGIDHFEVRTADGRRLVTVER